MDELEELGYTRSDHPWPSWTKSERGLQLQIVFRIEPFHEYLTLLLLDRTNELWLYAACVVTPTNVPEIAKVLEQKCYEAYWSELWAAGSGE